MTDRTAVWAGGARAAGSGGRSPLFARFAYPPNVLGFCGPPDHQSVLEHAATGVVDGGLLQLARQFTGAWPYLELLAGAARLADPLDPAVVEAYWVGSDLLDTVTLADLGGSLDGRFRRRLGTEWGPLAELVSWGRALTTTFTCSASTPGWACCAPGRSRSPCGFSTAAGSLGTGVGSAAPGRLLVRSPTARLGWSEAQPRGRFRRGGHGLHRGSALTRAAPGDWVALHWDWVCHRLSTRQLGALRQVTLGQLAVVNGASRPGPAALLG